MPENIESKKQQIKKVVLFVGKGLKGAAILVHELTASNVAEIVSRAIFGEIPASWRILCS